MKKLLIVILVLLVLGACSKEPAKTEVKLESKFETNVKVQDIIEPLNLISPDNTVKSMWKIAEYEGKIKKDLCVVRLSYESKFKENVNEVAKKLTTDLVLAHFQPSAGKCEQDSYSREITEVKTESETRTLVFAKYKNISQIPKGSVPTERDEKIRSEGYQFKYVLEKEVDGWKISKIYQESYLSKLMDKELTWDEKFIPLSSPYPSEVFTDY